MCDCCIVLQFVSVCCSVLQCVAVCGSVLQCVAVRKCDRMCDCCGVLQCVAVRYSVLQCGRVTGCVTVVVCCSVLLCQYFNMAPPSPVIQYGPSIIRERMCQQTRNNHLPPLPAARDRNLGYFSSTSPPPPPSTPPPPLSDDGGAIWKHWHTAQIATKTLIWYI